MPRRQKIESVFDAYTDGSWIPNEPELRYWPPARRRLGFTQFSPGLGLQQLKLILAAFENSPTPMRLLWLPVYCVTTESFMLEEYLQVLCRILELSTPNSLILEFVFIVSGFSAAEIENISPALDTIRQILCPALLACDALVHVGIHIAYASPEILPSAFIDVVDDVFTSTPTCHSLSLRMEASHPVSVADSLVRVLRKRLSAHVYDAYFHRITRIEYKFELVVKTAFHQFASEVSSSLRVSDFGIKCESDSFASTRDLPEYLSVMLMHPHITLCLAEALSRPSSSIRGLFLMGLKGLPASIAEVLGNAIGSSHLEEISIMPFLWPAVFDAIAEGISRSQVRHLWIRCGKGCDIESGLVKILACSSLRDLDIRVHSFQEELNRKFSPRTIALVLAHRGLEYYRVGHVLPQEEDDAYDAQCHGNFTESLRVLTLLLLKWVDSFTELRTVDINLLKIIRMLMVMPTE